MLSGAMATEWLEIGEKEDRAWYYFDEKGRMTVGWLGHQAI